MKKRFNPYNRFHGIFIPEGIYNIKIITPITKLVYGRLLRYSGKDGKCFPKQKVIADELCVSESAVKKAIKQLKDLDLIEVEKGNSLLHQSNRYHFLESDFLK